MRKMKDSGVEWIGEIPADWTVLKNKFLFSIQSGEAITREDLIENGTYPVYGGGEKIGYYDKYNVIENSILIGRVGARCGCITLVDTKCWATENALIITITDNYQYISYVLESEDLNRLNESNAQPLITATKIFNVNVPLPPLSEQEKIAAYLDHKFSEIDSLTADTQKQIETLEGYKRSVITEAVTKGLDPDAEMRDSGIEFIVYIPKHWEIRRIKTLGEVRNGLTYTPQDLCDSENGILVLRSSNVQNGKITLDDNVYVSCPVKSDLMVKNGDILICSRNGSRELIGKNAIIQDLTATFGAFMMIFRTRYPKYLYYILNSDIFRYYLGTFLLLQ